MMEMFSLLFMTSTAIEICKDLVKRYDSRELGAGSPSAAIGLPTARREVRINCCFFEQDKSGANNKARQCHKPGVLTRQEKLNTIFRG